MKITTLTKAIVLSVTLSVVSAGSALAVTSSLGDQTQLNTIITRGTQEINRRLDSLKTLGDKINSATRLTSADKTLLINQVNAETTSLTNLRAKLAADTSLTEARTDARSITAEYRVYALIVPKIAIIRMADSILQTSSKLSALAEKIQTRIDQAKSAGKNTASIQIQLDSMNEIITEANITANSLQAKVITLQPTDYNNDHTILSGYRDQLKSAHLQNVTAVADARAIVATLKALQ
jgi:hypothetical protein